MVFTTTSSEDRIHIRQNKLLWVYGLLFFFFWMTTLIGTTDITNWLIENTLTSIFLLFLIITYRKFQFSDLSYTFMLVYLLLHVYGSKYTYAENPFGYWLQETFNTSRNHYDRIVHFSFGLMLAYPMRDLFRSGFVWYRWICWILPVEITLSFSGLYELIEWSVADIFFPEQGVAYLGTQGDMWDAQKDMCTALLGAILIMLLTRTVKRLFRPGR